MTALSRKLEHSRREFLRLAAITGAILVPGVVSARTGAAATSDGREAFLKAVATGDLETVRSLLEAAPRLLEAVDSTGRSAFAVAHLGGHRPVGDLLVSSGFLPDTHESALAQDWDRFEELAAEDQSVVNRPHPIGGSAMYAAAIGGAGPELWRVYAAAGDPNLMPGGVSPVQAALRFRDLPTAEVTAATLLSNAADPNPPHSSDLPPLHIAAERGSLEMVEMLVRMGADAAARDRWMRTAGRVAEINGHSRVVDLLDRADEIPRSRQSSRSAYDSDGNRYAPPNVEDIPPLERRRLVGQAHFNLDYVREALAREPRLAHSVATTSEISVEACAHTGRREIVDCLLEHGAPYSIPTAVMRDDQQRVKQLLDQDPGRIHERGAHDFALLWYPIIGGCGLEILELLLERGAEIEKQHYLGTTALHWACLRGPVEVAKFLIDRGADVNRRGRKFNPEGETPLECARRGDRQDIVRLLEDHGATS